MNGINNKVTKPSPSRPPITGKTLPGTRTPPSIDGSKPKLPGTIMPRRITPPPANGSKPKLPGTIMPRRLPSPPDRSFDSNRVPGLTNL